MATRRPVPRSHPATALALITMMLIGCDRESDVASYTAPPDPNPPTIAQALPVSAGPSTSAAPLDVPRELTWQVPDGWVAQASDQPFRVATLEAGASEERVEVVITRVPGQRGGITENVNRWRQQIGLPPATQSEVVGMVLPLKNTHAFGMWADLQGADQRTLVAWFELPEASWYFKATAPHEAIATQRDAFVQLLESVKPAITSTQADAHVHTPDDGHDHDHADTTNLQSFQLGDIAGKLPPGWAVQPDPGQMRLAAFNVTSQRGAGLASVARFPGDVGGLLANINRWRNQLGLASITDPSQQDSIGHPLTNPIMRLYRFVAPQDTGDAKAMLVLIVPDAQSTWFIRLDTTAEALDEQTIGLRTFIDHLQLPLAIPPQPDAPAITPTPQGGER